MKTKNNNEMEIKVKGRGEYNVITCECGCVFTLEEKEFEIIKGSETNQFLKIAFCPECGQGSVAELDFRNKVRDALNADLAEATYRHKIKVERRERWKRFWGLNKRDNK